MRVRTVPWATALFVLLAVNVARARQGGDTLPGDPFEHLAPELQKCIAALDPLADGWTSEARSAAAWAQLAKIARFLETSGAERDALAGVFTGDFTAREAGPLEDVFRDRAFLVQRPARDSRDGEGERVDRAEFLRRLGRPVAEAHEIHARFEVVSVEEQDQVLVTRALLLLEGLGAAGTIQVNSRWECRWSEEAGGEAAPHLRSVEVLQHEEVHGLVPGAHLFADCTEALLGANPAWAEQLLPGLSHWRARLDTRLGLPLLGHAAGIAVGDVDGDGLEDLYLCQPGGLPNKLFVHGPDGTAQDRSASAGVDFLDSSRAALLLDFDGDGDRDLAVTVADRLLFLSNDGKAHFWLESALPAPDSTSLAASDVDLDGDLDVYVCASASPYDQSALPLPYHDANNGKPNTLFENQGDWSLADATVARGLDQNNRRFSFAASFEDYDLDGDGDLYVANAFGRNNLYRNDGGTFVDVAAAAGVEDSSSSLGVTWGDHDGDGRFDLYVSNRYSSAGNRITTQSRFQPAAGEEVRGVYRRDARGNTLFLNAGDGTFRDATDGGPLGVAMGRWAFGALFCDLNQDGWQDLLSPNGFVTEELTDDLGSFFWREVVSRSPLSAAPPGGEVEPYAIAWAAVNKLLRRGHSWSGREPNCAFLDLGEGHTELGRFANVSSASGFGFPDDARASALCDWDGDGDEDVFLTNRSGPRVRFLRNDQATGNASVTLVLRGTRCNRDAIGARVELVLDERGKGRTLLRGVRAGEGTLAQSSTRLVVGLGAENARIERVLVHWPGGEREEFRSIEPRAAWLLVQGSGRGERLPRAGGERPAPPLASGAPRPPATGLAARVPLVRPVPLPRLELAASDGSPLALFGLKPGGEGTGTGKALLLLLFSVDCASCADELASLVARARELEAAGLTLLALCVDPGERRAAAEPFLERAGWPYPWAAASRDTIELLDAFQGALLDRERRMPLSTGFLVDPAGAVRVLYLGPAPADQLLADLAVLALGEGALLEKATPFVGRWMFPTLPTDADFFESRLLARGLEAPAREYSRGRMAVVRTSPAVLLQQFGRRAAQEERLDEAIAFFRRAVALDPANFDALSDWAIVLHRREELAAAVELYAKALALKPDHADTRFNLALAWLGLGNRARAEKELRWLQARGAESAAVLEQVLARPGAPK